VVISWHSDIVRQEKILSLYRPLLDRLLARADAVIAVTPAHFESSTQLHACPSERRHVVSYGAEYSVYKAKDALLAHAARLRAFHGSNRLIFAVGRHVYYKGFDYLIRAMRQI
jgi:rhamnosyl/mannosyltransferase